MTGIRVYQSMSRIVDLQQDVVCFGIQGLYALRRRRITPAQRTRGVAAPSMIGHARMSTVSPARIDSSAAKHIATDHRPSSPVQ